MARTRFIQAINDAIRDEMERDKKVILFGEDVEASIFGDTRGLIDRPVAVLFAVVIGGIYSVILTPTEPGGIGAVGALIIAMFAPGFNLKKLIDALLEATQTSAILIGVGLSLVEESGNRSIVRINVGAESE